MEPINKFQKWMLRAMFRGLFTQGPHHESNIIAVYSIVTETARNEFTEDNQPTLNGFLEDCHNKAEWR
jgi:hypothetical protein